MFWPEKISFPPNCLNAVDVAVSPMGNRAFIGCSYTNNLGMVENPLNLASNDVIIATAADTASGVQIRDVAWTPYKNRVLAAMWYNSLAASKLMVLNSDSVKVSDGGTITKYYSFITGNSGNQINGPEGIGVWPHFDRDGDKISDLIEAANFDVLFTNESYGNTAYFDPTIFNVDPSQAMGDPGSGSLMNGIRLPEEGIGYRHFYGSDRLNFDNWGTLRLVQIIEAVGREWNLRHPGKARISIGDMSKRQGGDWHPDHVSHQNGRDVDIRYLLTNYSEGATDFCRSYPNCDEANPSNYDQALTIELVNLFVKYGASLIYVDPDAMPEGGVIEWRGEDGDADCGTPDVDEQKCINKYRDHSNHFHVRIP